MAELAVEYERNATQLAIALFADNEHGLVVTWFSPISMEQSGRIGVALDLARVG